MTDEFKIILYVNKEPIKPCCLNVNRGLCTCTRIMRFSVCRCSIKFYSVDDLMTLIIITTARFPFNFLPSRARTSLDFADRRDRFRTSLPRRSHKVPSSSARARSRSGVVYQSKGHTGYNTIARGTSVLFLT